MALGLGTDSQGRKGSKGCSILGVFIYVVLGLDSNYPNEYKCQNIVEKNL